MLRYLRIALLLLAFIVFEHSAGFVVRPPLDHAKVARRLVHQSNWAPIGTISTAAKIVGFPMVNIVSIDDNNAAGKSTGLIHFLLTDLDYTGTDYRALNKVTFLFTDAENCAKRGVDPMEPTCARTIISGEIKKMDEGAQNYSEYLDAFIKRHPAAKTWMNVPGHNFYLCELEIKNIFVLDFYGGPHDISVEEFLKASP